MAALLLAQNALNGMGELISSVLTQQASEFRSAIGKCRPDCRPILMSGRQKVADLNFALE